MVPVSWTRGRGRWVAALEWPARPTAARGGAGAAGEDSVGDRAAAAAAAALHGGESGGTANGEHWLYFAILNPHLDNHASGYISNGGWEWQLTHAFRAILRRRIWRDAAGAALPASELLVVDVGANLGWFVVHAASMG